jgi:hypothetical protein
LLFLFDFFFFWNVGALAAAKARTASLEAELSASRKAYDAATDAKIAADKSQKSTLAKAKKAEKALADAEKKHRLREQAMAERLQTMSTAAEGTYSAFPLFRLPFIFLYFAKIFLPCFSCSFYYTGFTGVSLSALQPGDDPLMSAVNLLKANWISIRETFELVSRVLTRMFVGLWPKQRVDVPKDDVKKLAKAFDTTEDPILQLKGLSLKRGDEGAIALSYAHGGDFDWEKVSSPHGRSRSELKTFFEKAKKLAPALVSIISPSDASTTSAAPTPATEETRTSFDCWQ